jgi:drug/metabolite transporter (DMT)-like permease
VRNAIAALLALGAAALFGIGNALEHREVFENEGEELDPALLGRLAKRKRWWLGMTCDVGAYGLHATALALGSLVLVQPILPLNLLFAIPLAARWRHRRVSHQEIGLAILLCASLAIFLYRAAPSEGASSASITRWLPALLVLGVAVAATIEIAHHLHGSQRAVCLGLGAGLCYGVNSALTKTFAHLVPEGPVAVLTHWEPYALAIATFTGLWLAQSMFQGAEIGAGLPVNETVEPITASVLGIALFHESLNLGARGNMLLLLVAALVALACVWRLSQTDADTFTTA